MYETELKHHGILGMKWGVRRFQNADGSLTAAGKKRYDDADNLTRDEQTKRIKENAKKSINKAKEKIKEHANDEIVQRGRSAFDVLINGDTDWMGNSISADDPTDELKNRGKAALERLLYSADQIDNKKFYGRYNF